MRIEKEKEDKEKEETKKDTTNKIAPPKKGWEPYFEGLDNRKIRLTINSGNISDYILSNDGEKLYLHCPHGKRLRSVDDQSQEQKKQNLLLNWMVVLQA